MLNRPIIVITLLMLGGVALAQQAPPPPPSAATAVPAVTPGLTPDLAEAARMIQDGQYAAAWVKIDAALAADAKNPQARFLRGVVQADQDQPDEALATFQGLTEDFPELPEPYNNLAVIWAQRGQYEKARTALESAIASHPDYAIAHENLGDIYSRLAGAEYDRAVVLDKTNKSAQAKLVLVRQLYAVAPSSNAPKAVTPVPKPAAPANDKK
ncbi:MAG TPA: tetratricopeptide repeat protein [Casimicrobiaceae bacterium]|nr:tetratricopeptide repeat protein [Casimicrobiaceae bacterium]